MSLLRPYPRPDKQRRIRPLALALAAALALHAPISAADGLADEAELQFQLGASSYQKGDFTGALEHFLASNRLVPNRRVVFNIARSYEQLRQWPEAYRYYVEALAGETDPTAIEGAKAAIARLGPNVAVLDVTTDPPGATLYIDRKDLGSRGKAPRPLGLPEGRYRVIAELEGYEPKTSEEITVKPGSVTPVALKLERIVGRVRIELSGAPHAAVRVDDETAPPACTAPCELSLPPGPHELFFAGESVFAPPRKVNVTAHGSTTLNVALRALTGTVVVSTQEPGALVTIDGRTAGFTPAVIRDVPAGKRRLRIALRGHAAWERDIDVHAGQQTDLGMQDLAPLREVTAVSRYAERLEDAPSSVSIIDGREIAAFGYPTIAESLRGVRGISLSNDRVYASVAVRTVGQPNDYGNRVLVLSDGQPLNDDLLNSSYIGSDGRGDLHDVERIEVVRGPGSLLYGAGAFSGVINLVTRSREAPTSVHVGIGSYDNAALRGRGGFHLNLGPDRGLWASGWGVQSNGFSAAIPTTDAPTPRVVDGVERFASGGTAGRAYFGPATVQWFFHKRVQSVPVGAYQTEVGNPRTAFADTRAMVEARYEPRIGDSLQLLLRAHANHYGYDGLYAFPGGTTNHEVFAGTWMGGEARLVYAPSPRLRATVGGEAQWHPVATLLGQTEGGNNPGKYLDAERPYRFGAAYALAEGAPAPWVRLSGGVRLDVYSTFGAILVPRAAIILKPNAGGTLKIMGGRGFRAPSIYEQLYNDNGHSQVAAVDLKPETIYSGEAEFSQRFREDWVALATAYGSYVENLIATAPAPTPTNPNLVQYANQDTAFVAGGDAEIRREWRHGWMLSATYSYQYARYVRGARDNQRVPNVPDHLASFRGVVPLVPELLSAALRVTLEAPRRLFDGSETSADVVADLVLSGEARAFGLRYALGMYNLADRRYAVPVTATFRSPTMPQNGRTFLLDLMWSYP